MTHYEVGSVETGRVTLAVDDQGSGRLVLLVHGFPLDRQMWSHQVATIVEQGHRAIAVDLRGYGESTLAPHDGNDGVDMHRYADDLAELLLAMRIDEPVVLAGFSMGGYIAWEFARRHAKRLAALILCDTRAGADSKEAADNRLKMAELVDKWGTRHVADMMIPKLFAPSSQAEQSKVVDAVREVIESTPTAAIAAAQRGMARRQDFSERLEEFALPALLIAGEHDAISPPAEMRNVAERLPNGQFVQISEAGHMAPVENPAAVSSAITQFLAEL